MVDGKAQILQFLIVDSRFRLGKQTVLPGLYFYKYRTVVILCDDVYVAMAGMPVALQNHIAFLTQVGCCYFFSADTQLDMFGSFLVELLAGGSLLK